MKIPEEFFVRLGELVNEQRLAVLATQGDTGPYASLVAVSASRDLKTYYFTTPRTTRKFANLMANSAAALLLENAANRPADDQDAMAVTITGTAEEVPPAEADDFDAVFLVRHPHLEPFLRLETTARMRIRAEAFNLVRHFQEVTTYRVAPQPA